MIGEDDYAGVKKTREEKPKTERVTGLNFTTKIIPIQVLRMYCFRTPILFRAFNTREYTNGKTEFVKKCFENDNRLFNI